MDRENGRPVSKANIEPFGGGSTYRHFRFFVMLGLIYGVIVASVLHTSPAAITVVTYAVPVFAVAGIGRRSRISWARSITSGVSLSFHL